MAEIGRTSVPAWAFWLGTIVVFAVIATIIWFAIPAPDARHRFVSPSGAVAVELTERCDDTGCTRAIVAERAATSGTKARFGCNVPLTEQHPVLLNAHPLWAADETAVDIVFADAEGIGGRFSLVFDRDCAGGVR